MKFVFDLDGTLCFDGMTMSKDLQKVLLTAPNTGMKLFLQQHALTETVLVF
ncbi:hypothetical protein [Streptococcus thermophilus]|uniref:hypothetical protein n=1 Tax=Streptococcus thermophilus TaxID=1308 RepID=UPI0022FE4C02|nr:hypothetical protein [Streptococcus thermophilus]MDA5538370.1 hypothetical protein [Streptococcus thermophilus]MDA5552056.1 hypothetical protein [Streptococcus thermophilus]WCL59561.1 hypothetical protein PND17_05045 [Streptococcus thermophilus]